MSAAYTGKHQRPSGDLRRTVRLFRRFMGGRRVYVIALLFLVFEAVTAVVSPYPIAFLIDYLQGARPSARELGLPALISSERFETILVLTLAIVLIAAINSAADSLTEVCMARGGRSLGYSIRIAMYSHLQRLPLGYHDRKRTGDVLTRVTGDVLVLEDFVVKSASNIVGSLLVLLGSFGFLLYQSWGVALIGLAVVPMLATVSNIYSRRIKVASKTQRDREGELASTAQEMLSSIRLVQSYGRGTLDLERFSSQTGKSMFASLRAANIQAQFSFVIALVEALSIAAVVWLGVWLVDRRAISVGTLVLFVLLLQNMFKPARKIVSEWYKVGKVFASVERINDLLDRDVVVADRPDAVTAPPLTGRLAFRHVRFTYPAGNEGGGSPATDRAAVLRDIDFEVTPGEVVALVGPSGAGKSTIAQLIPRLYDPDAGEVLVDGQPVDGFTLASLRRQVSLVLQDTVLLSGTVAENIGYGVDQPRQEDIEAAARMANAHEFIMGLPDGYGTELGERGATLSGGQRQRLSIARAFIRQAPILILDEPTTGLDTESAQTVVSALKDLMRATTTIVISHDQGLIRCADRILVVRRGRVVELGTHEVLLAAPGIYAGLTVTDEARRTLSETASRPAPSAPAGAPDTASPAVGIPHGSAAVSLREQLEERLPGLALASDEGRVAGPLRDLLGGAPIEGISPGTFWLRQDGTCTLRYRPVARDGGGVEREHLVLGRVHADDGAAQRYLDTRLGTATKAPSGSVGRAGTRLVEGAALALHAFPLDPELPTLARAVDAGTVAGLLLRHPAGRRPDIDVVHYPRQGACVMRYTFANASGRSSGDPAAVLYGKVYPDLRGDAVDGFLRAMAQQPLTDADQGHAVFPPPVLYAPALRLLVTRALRGEPMIPRLLGTVLGAPPGSSPPELSQLHAAVAAAGGALAVLHGSNLATAPLHSQEDERQALTRQLELVEQFWPAAGSALRDATGFVTTKSWSASDLVLSHGDFTPSQVLLDGTGTAVVDLDTACWADPALDLGRFLAQLELLAAKRAGHRAQPLVQELGHSFLAGYAQAATDTTGIAERIAFYRASSLARSAMHACRQLKSYRFELALGLLESTSARRVDL